MSWHSRVKDRRLWDFCDEKHLHKTQEECHWWCKQEWKLDQQEFDTDFLFHHNPIHTHVGKNFLLSSSHIWNTTHNNYSFPSMLYIHQFQWKKKKQAIIGTTGSPHKLSDSCNVWILEKMYGNIEKVHIIVIQWNEFSQIRSKLMCFYAKRKTLRITIIH